MKSLKSKLRTWVPFATLALGAIAFSVHAAPQFPCEIWWDRLTEFDRASPNEDIYGVKVQDWKREYFDAAWQKQEACLAAETYDDSMKEAKRRITKPKFERAKQAFDRWRLKQEALVPAGTVVNVSNLSLVKFSADGKPVSIQIEYESGIQRERTCSNLDEPFHFATFETYRQAAVFARLCETGKQGRDGLVSIMEKRAKGYSPFRESFDLFRIRLAQAEKASFIPPTQMQQLSAMNTRWQEQSKAIDVALSKESLSDLLNRLKAVQAKPSDTPEVLKCSGAMKKRGFPDTWNNYNIGIFGMTSDFRSFVCASVDTGAIVRYVPKGWFDPEGYEIKSKNRTVKVLVKIYRKPVVNTDFLYPVKVIANGSEIKVNDSTIVTIQQEILVAIRNE